MTNTLTGNSGYNTPPSGSADQSNYFTIVGDSNGNSTITEAQGASGLGADFICSANAQINIQNVTLQIADDKQGIEAYSGCQVYLSGSFITFDSQGTTNGALSALYQRYSSVIHVGGSTTITFKGHFKTVLNGEGTGEIEFSNTGGTANNVLCTGVTLTSGTARTAFIDAELHSIIHLEPGWNFDYSPGGCGPSAGGITGSAGTLQVALTTGAFLNNETGSNLPGPCVVSPYSPCVDIETGSILAPYGVPTVAGSCSHGAVMDGSTNYAGGITFRGGNTSCFVTFGYAGGTTTSPPTPTTTTTPTPAFSTAPMCTATSSPYNSSSPSNFVSINYATTAGGVVTGMTLTPSSGWVYGDAVYYVCSASSTG